MFSYRERICNTQRICNCTEIKYQRPTTIAIVHRLAKLAIKKRTCMGGHRCLGSLRHSRHMPDKIAIVTGSSSGIGLLTAIELAKNGFKVVASMRDLERRARLDEACVSSKGDWSTRISVVSM